MAGIIRPAAVGGLPEIQRIVHAVYSKYVERLGKPPAPMLDNYHRHIVAHEAWVMLDGTDVTGVLILVPRADHLLLDNVAVDPRFRGKGIGRALIESPNAKPRGANTTKYVCSRIRKCTRTC